MADIGVLALRGLAGGTLVVIFALIGEVVAAGLACCVVGWAAVDLGLYWAVFVGCALTRAAGWPRPCRASS